MSLRIDDFKTALVGGGARANLMRVNLSWPNADIQGDANFNFGGDALHSFMVKGAQLPGRTINSVPVPFRGRELKVSGDSTFEDLTLTIINDNNFAIRNAFERWQDAINSAVSNESARGVDAASFATYTANLEVEQLGRNGDVIKRYVINGAWPTTVDAIDVGFDNTDTIEEFGVTFAYQWWESDTVSSSGSSRVTSGVVTPTL